MVEIDCRKCQNLQTVAGSTHVGRLTARCKCYGPADKAPERCAADAFKYYYPMRTPDEYKPGMTVWCVERNNSDEPAEVNDYVFLAKVQAAVIASPYYDGTNDLDDVLSYHYQETRDENETALRVFPACDCYPAESLAREALAKEREEAGR